MRRAIVLVTIGLGIGFAQILGGPAVGTSARAVPTSPDQTAIRSAPLQTAEHTPAIPFEDIVAQVKAAGFTKVYSISLEHGRYEIKADHPKGWIVEIFIDPKSREFQRDPGSGEVLSRRVSSSYSAKPPILAQDIVAQVTAAGFSDIHSIEYEHALYEVQARDAKGRRVELYVHPKTGELIKHPRTGKPLVEVIEGKAP